MKTNSFDKVVEQFANMMVEKINEVSMNWQKPWFNISSGTKNFIPQNLTGRKYSGGNLFTLLMACEAHNYQTPVFLTFNQAKEAGLTILKGSKSFPIYYFIFFVYHKETKEKISYEEYKELSTEEKKKYNVFPAGRYFCVFNLDQTNFSEKYHDKWEQLLSFFRNREQSPVTDSYSNEIIDNMLANSSWCCPIIQRESDSAFYSPSQDYINVPEKRQFVDGESFYSTLLHEMGHSTGHETRLKRKFGSFGSPDYAVEELKVELSSALVGFFLGFATTPREENACYLKSWLSAIHEDPKFVLSLLSDCSRILRFMSEYLKLDLETYSETEEPETIKAVS